MDEGRTTDGKLEALEAMREEAMTTKRSARAVVKALAGRLARGGETSEEARAKTVEVVACALRVGVWDDEEGDGEEEGVQTWASLLATVHETIDCRRVVESSREAAGNVVGAEAEAAAAFPRSRGLQIKWLDRAK